MNRRSMKTQALLKLGLVFVILILLNIVSVRLFSRFDMTREKAFELSSASRELVRSLDDRITVKAYFSEDVASTKNVRRAVLDQLNEYKAYSAGNLHFEFIDPSGEKGEEEAQLQGIVPIQAQVVREDKFEIQRAYMGLVFLYEDRKEVIPVVPVVQNPGTVEFKLTGTLEYDISSTIKRLTTRVRKKVGFSTGHGEPALNEVSRVQQILGKQYEVSQVDLTEGKPVPEDIRVLVIMAPTKRFSDPEKYQIDQFLMRGGRVAFLLNRIDANLQARFARPAEVDLEDILEAYGLRINADLVRDVQCANVSIVQQQFGFSITSQVPYPLLPLAGNLASENMMVKDLQGIVLYFASSIDTVNLAARNLRGEILMRTSDRSGRQTGMMMLDPMQRYAREDFEEKHIPLAAVVSGQFTSAFAGRPVPVDTVAEISSPAGLPVTQSPETRIVLVGDGDFARDPYLGNRDNLTFFANMVDYLMDDAGLISIRSKDVAMPQLQQVSDTARKMIKYGNLFLPPVLVMAYGLIRWRVRTARRKALEMH